MRLGLMEKKTIFRRLLIPILALLVLQTLCFTMVVLRGGAVEQANRNAFDILGERVINRQIYLENEMVHRWSNLSSSEQEIIHITESILEHGDATLSHLKTDAALNGAVVQAAVPEVVRLLRRNGVTGAFLVLDGLGVEEMPWTYAGFYVRDLDPDSYTSDNADLLMERGLPTISKSLNIPLDSYWTASFEFPGDGAAENEKFFYEPLRAAQTASLEERTDSSNFGYWSGIFSLSESDTKVITYSIPLIYPDGTPFGVLGVDVTQSYLMSQLRYDELMPDKDGAYFLGIARDGDLSSLERVCSSGPLYRMYFGESDILTGAPDDKYSSIFRLAPSRDAERTFYGSYQKIPLYNVNTPFEHQQWVLVGIAAGDRLLSFADRLRFLVYLSAFITFLFGLVVAFAASRMMTRPITRLVEELKASDPRRPVTLPKIRIAEIDELTVSIENLSGAVAESSSKISKIISMANIPIGAFEYDYGGKYVFYSSSLVRILEGKDLGQEEFGDDYNRFVRMMKTLEENIYNRDQLLYRIPRGDKVQWVQLVYLEENNRVLGVAQDVTKEMQEKQKIAYERDYDVLTSLYNRRAFEAQLSRLFAEPEQLGTAALVMFDLDNLKYINDTYGHDYGDQYICALAQELALLNQEGHGIVARRSGDEFYVLLYGYQGHEEISTLIEQNWQQIKTRSITLPNGEFNLRVSAGMAWYPDDSTDFEELIRYADFAMYTIKHSGKGNLKRFDPDSYHDNSILISGQGALNRLIDNQLVRYAMQPIISVENANVYGYEMLMRSMVEELKTPMDILRVARSESRLYQIERMTFFTAMQTFVEQVEQRRISRSAHVFINSIPNHTMTQRDIRKFGELYQYYLHNIVVEITESDPATDVCVRQKRAIAHQWDALIAIDDFGSGYSNEAALLSSSPDFVKLDISMVRGIDQDTDRMEIVRNLISFAKKRNIRVLAEGVETRKELETLIALEVDYLQGYYLGKPSFEVQTLSPDVAREISDAVAEREKVKVR